jgi:hypothetical protein
VRHFDGAVGDGIGAFERADDLAGGEDLNVEVAVGGFSDRFAEKTSAAP